METEPQTTETKPEKEKRSWHQILRPYIGNLPDITKFNLFSGAIIAVVSFINKQLALFLIRTTGRDAISTGDFAFLFKTWQGPFILFLGFLIIFVYFIFDLIGQILFSEQLLRGKPDIKEVIKGSFFSIQKFLNWDSVPIILYIALIAPLVGFGFTISLTDSLYLPNFISSVINSVPLYRVLYWIFIAVFIFIGVFNIFTLHGILLNDLPANIADDESRKTMKENWRHFLKAQLNFVLLNVVYYTLQFIFVALIPASLVLLLIKDSTGLRFAGYIILFVNLSLFTLMLTYFKTFYMMRMTQLYHQYRGEEVHFELRVNKTKWFMTMAMLMIEAAFLIGMSFVLANYFDQIFTTKVNTQVIAHRAGGVEAPENTVTGIEKAIELGAYGAEIDIQRTKDGFYIVNHDSSFSRLCNNKAKPEDLTLDEIKDLIIRDPNFPNMEEDVATFEEMLDASKDKIILFVELKGNTADEQMAEDAVRIIKEKGMEKQCVLISLKYPLINYIETKYPEMDTAYLTFASFGNTQNLNCDYLGLEEEAASVRIISMIHESGKKVMVWTPNSLESQKKFLISEADYIITDKVLQADNMIEELKRRDRIDVILDAINYAQ